MINKGANAAPADSAPVGLARSTTRAGMTPQAVARLFMIGLIVFGPYLSSMFAFDWAAPTKAKAAASQVPAAQTPPVAASDPVSSTDFRISTPERIGPTAGGCGTPNYASGTTPFPDGTTSFLKGVQGTAVSRNTTSAYNLSPVTVTVQKAGDFSNIKSVTTFGDGTYGFDIDGDTNGNDPTGLPTNQAMILKFQASGNTTGANVPQISYFDYFGSGDTSFGMGRYSPQTATRFYLSSNCTAYAFVEPGTLSGVTGLNPGGVADAPAGLVAITMTLPNNTMLGQRFFDGAVSLGRSIGGRIFVDNGTDDPQPYIHTIDPLNPKPNVAVAIYTYTNNTAVLTQAIAVVNADPEGYYMLAGNDSTNGPGITRTIPIPANTNGDYVIEFRSAGNIATSYYCNYLYTSPDNTLNPASGFNPGNIIPLHLKTTDTQNVAVTSSGNPKALQHNNTTGAPPCATNPGDPRKLSVAGINEAVLGKVQITGKITLNGSPDPTGAYATAFNKNTGKAEGSGTADSGGNYTISGLRPGVQYYVEFFPPPTDVGSEYVAEYYNNIQTDKIGSTPPTTIGPIPSTVSSSSVDNINATLDKGWKFSGTVTLNGQGSIPNKINVLVYKTVDLLNNANPVPVGSTSTDTATGHYDTPQVMMPGISYTLSFVPYQEAQVYKSAWCQLVNTTCTPVENYSLASATLIDSARANHTFQADITLNKGVVLAGTLSGINGQNAALSLAGTPVNIYIYQVSVKGDVNTPLITPTLAQYFSIPSSAGATLSYTSAAVEEATKYVIQAVPDTSNSIGFRSGFYCGNNASLANCVPAAGLKGSVFTFDQAVPVSNPVAPAQLNNLDIGVYEAAGIKVQLYTYLFPTVTNAYYPGVRVTVYGDGQDRSSGAKPIGSGLTNSQGQATINGLGVQQPGGAPYKIYFEPTGTRGFANYVGTQQCVGDKPATPVNPNVTSLNTYIQITCALPPFSGADGLILTNPGDQTVDWSNSSLNIYDSNNNFIVNITNTNNQVQNSSLEIEHNTAQTTWDWSVYYPSGNYKFQLVPGKPASSLYLPHWAALAANNGVDQSKATTWNLTPEFAVTQANFNFRPGGVLKVKVVDTFGIPIPNALVTYYDGTNGTCNTATQLQAQTAADSAGVNYSQPSTVPLCARADPPAGGAYSSSLSASQTLTDAQGNVIIKNITIVLQPTPYISGVVRVHNGGNTEVGISDTIVSAVDTNGQIIGTASGKTDVNGYYRFAVPTVPFKLKFLPQSGYEARYWTNSPKQNGTPTLAQGNTITPLGGTSLNNYNQIYDTLVGLGCAVTDQYVQGTSYSGGYYYATVGFSTNCPGNNIVGYSSSSQQPVLSNYTVISTTGSSYSHVVGQVGPLTPGLTYYLRTFSTVSVPAGGNQLVAGPEELRLALPYNSPTIPTSNDGKNWFFAQGETGAAGSNISETLNIANYNATAANLSITYYKPDGTASTVGTLSVPANSRLDLQVDGTGTNSLSNLLASYVGPHSTWVRSDLSVVVERTQNRSGTLSNGKGYRGGYTVAGATAPGGDWYFPDISTKPASQQIVSIFNPNAAKACVSLEYYRKTGASIQIASNWTQLGPRQRVDLNVNASIHTPVSGGADPAPGETDFGLHVLAVQNTSVGCTQGVVVTDTNGSPITYGLPVVAEEQTRYAESVGDYNYRGVAGSFGSQTDSLNWYFLDGQSDKTTDVTYNLINPTGSTVNITVTFQGDVGSGSAVGTISQYTFSLAAKQRFTYSVPFTLVTRAAPGSRLGFTAKIESNRRVVAERTVKYVYNQATSQNGLYHENGTNRASTQWLFAAGDTLADDTTPAYTDESLNLYNPSPVSTLVTVTYYFANAATPPQVFVGYNLAPYQRAVIQPGATANLALNPASGYPAVGLNRAIAAKVESAQGIFVERLIYYRKGGQAGGNATYGYNPLGY